MFYQDSNFSDMEMPRVEIGRDFSFGVHFHNSFEFIAVTEGEMTVTVDDRKYTLTPQNAILIFPNQPHSLCTERHSKHVLCIFSKKIVKAFSSVAENKIPVSSVFRPDRFYVESLLHLSNNSSFIKSKGLIYSLCGQFHESAEYVEQKFRSEMLLKDIFDFIEMNFRGDCSLNALAKHTLYNTAYLSKYFKQRIGIGYIDYVNKIRVSEAIYLITNTNKKMVDIAHECGFNNVRNFNRNFKKITDITPNVYRSRLSVNL